MRRANQEQVKQQATDQQQAQHQGDAIGHLLPPIIQRNARSRMARGALDCKSGQAVAMATATSAIRTEKAHSLSYQASTRTIRLPTTRVWSGAKIELCSV